MSEFSLRAGPLNLLYQNGFIRYVSRGQDEILRMIYFALRDENWGTYAPIIENEVIENHKDHFLIQHDCFHELHGKRIFHWKTCITGDQQGQINFAIKGVALEDVKKNRAGLCILHPIKGVAGVECETFHVEGKSNFNHFPVFVSPHNPFKDLEGMRWKSFGTWWSLHFEGDVFETEDQRNWTDASFKTFCTPLQKLFPVQLLKGDQVSQKVVFHSETRPDHVDSASKLITITATMEESKLVPIGIGASAETDALSANAITLLRKLSLSHYRVEVHFDTDDWVSKFSANCANASMLSLPLEAAVHLTEKFEKELEKLIALILQNNVRLKYLILFSKGKLVTNQSIVDYADKVKEQLPFAMIGAGTDYNFAELNRNRFQQNPIDFISFSINPQEHACDNLTLTENIEAQMEVVRSAQAIYPNKPIHISPLTLKRRFNPYATDSAAISLPNDQKSDARQIKSFGAAFMLGSIKILSQAQAGSLTLFQAIGAQGLLSIEDEVYPNYLILKEILSENHKILHTTSTNPLHADALLLKGQHAKKLFLFNYTEAKQNVLFEGSHYELMPHEIKVIKDFR